MSNVVLALRGYLLSEPQNRTNNFVFWVRAWTYINFQHCTDSRDSRVCVITCSASQQGLMSITKSLKICLWNLSLQHYHAYSSVQHTTISVSLMFIHNPKIICSCTKQLGPAPERCKQHSPSKHETPHKSNSTTHSTHPTAKRINVHTISTATHEIYVYVLRLRTNSELSSQGVTATFNSRLQCQNMTNKLLI